MTSMNISLPDGLKDFVERQVRERQYSSASEYIRQLIREDHDRTEQRRLEAQLLEGINSGPAQPLDAQLRRELRERAAQSTDTPGNRRDDVA